MWGKSIKALIFWNVYNIYAFCKEKMVKIIGGEETIMKSIFPSTINISRTLLFGFSDYLWKCVSYIYFEFCSEKWHDTSLKRSAENEFSRFFYIMKITYLGIKINTTHNWEISLPKTCCTLVSQTQNTECSFNSSPHIWCVKLLL